VAVEFDNKIKRIAEHFEDKISEVKKGVGMTMKATADLNEKIESEVAKVERKIEGKTDETGVINLLNERTKKTNDALANNRKLTSTVEREKKHEIQNANQKAYYDAKKNKTKVNLSAVSHDEGLVM